MDTVEVVKLFKSPAASVWAALTDTEAMKKWYFHVLDFELIEGKVFTFYETETNGTFLHQCRILRVVPFEVLEHTWEHPSHSKGISTLTWTLKAVSAEETQLTLVHSGLLNFADGGPAFAPENFLAGWDAIVNISLRNYLYGIEKLIFTTEIDASPERVWEVLWGKKSYSEWTSVFTEGSYFEGELAQGNRVHLLSPSGDGLYSDILYVDENRKLIFSHIGYLSDGQEKPLDAETELWTGSLETYELEPTEAGTRLTVELDNQKEYHDSMNLKFPAALQKLQELAESAS